MRIASNKLTGPIPVISAVVKGWSKDTPTKLWAAKLYQGLQTRYPDRKLIPFAKRSDCDYTACFEIGKGGTVQLIHDFAGPGWEQRQEFPDCWAWLAQAVNDMIEYNREDGIL